MIPGSVPLDVFNTILDYVDNVGFYAAPMFVSGDVYFTDRRGDPRLIRFSDGLILVNDGDVNITCDVENGTLVCNADEHDSVIVSATHSDLYSDLFSNYLILNCDAKIDRLAATRLATRYQLLVECNIHNYDEGSYKYYEVIFVDGFESRDIEERFRMLARMALSEGINNKAFVVTRAAILDDGSVRMLDYVGFVTRNAPVDRLAMKAVLLLVVPVRVVDAHGILTRGVDWVTLPAYIYCRIKDDEEGDEHKLAERLRCVLKTVSAVADTHLLAIVTGYKHTLLETLEEYIMYNIV